MMNMLIGILTEVVIRVSDEQDNVTKHKEIRASVMDLLEVYDVNEDKRLHQTEFERLMKNPDLGVILARHDIEVGDLEKLGMFLFEETGEQQALEQNKTSLEPKSVSIDHNDFLDHLSKLQGSTNASVTDVAELRGYVRKRVKKIEQLLEDKEAQVSGADGAGADTMFAPPQISGPGKQQFEQDLLSELRAMRQHQDQLRAQVQELRSRVDEVPT